VKQLYFFSTHTGAGGADCGAISAGLTPVGGIEIDPYPVALYRSNFGDHIRHESILDTDIGQLPDFDFFWSSPTCVNFSTAKTDGGETEADIAVAKKVAEIIKAKKPRYFALENVRGYLKDSKGRMSESFSAILSALEAYNVHYAIYDAADFGVPQNRDRLILRASRDPLRSLATTHAKGGGLWWKPWCGWYDAVADLLPSCKPSHLTERQIAALEKKGWYGEAQRAIAVSSEYLQQNGKPGRGDELPIGTLTTQGRPLAVMVERQLGFRDPLVRSADQPCNTIGANQDGGGRLPKAVLIDGKANGYGSSVTAVDGSLPSYSVTASSSKQLSRAVLLERVGYGKDRDPTMRDEAEPSITIRAASGCDERGGYRSPLTALLEYADVRALDYRCLARLQSFPNDYKWGSSSGKNCKAIGNAAPPLLVQRVIESMVGVICHQ
jgi:DNA (cytosine-5)-methyltransferase 1